MYNTGTGEEKRRSHHPQVSSNVMISLSISFLIKKCTGRRLTKVIILCMARLGRWVVATMALSVSGSIFSYSLAWNSVLLSGLEDCTDGILWKDHTIIENWLNTSSLSSAPTVYPAQRGSMLVMSLSYSCFVANQTVAIWIK